MKMPKKKTTRICVTMEKTIRVCEYFDATQEEIDQIRFDGKNPFFDRLKEICTEENGDVEYDYAIEDEDTKKTLVDWD